jgi:hypothetical protein
MDILFIWGWADVRESDCGLIFRPKKEEITDGQKKLGNEKICSLCSRRVIRAFKIRWVGHAVSMARREMLKGVFLENLKERNT